ncbi:hypothetical protein [Aeromicrobium fastidiosum]|uniref:PBP domain-containing protein n=1 Tax=Aeromicrobium fastidiosum TaxID=52699 RepID=A0A641AMK1_9ACTN|nr:hypothetical protein [Aeromicrobium fastidiosum]KAA1376032.1 hypothetical protein ESP62_011285 [Aeromicrobium fastidiosum]MBP2392098.1 hypothetical protein [Aeromicrobium fastidiosum]
MTTYIRPREIVALLLAAGLMVSMVVTGGAPASAASTGEGAFTKTKTVTRTFTGDASVEADPEPTPTGATPTPTDASPSPTGASPTPTDDAPSPTDTPETAEVVDSRDVTLNVDHTLNLRGRERVKVSWTGARPTAGRAANPYGEKGMAQEYPMVILQCRGLDDASLPAAQQLSPKTCWTSTLQQRSQTTGGRLAIWRHDTEAATADRDEVSGVDTVPEGCPDIGDDSVHLTPFVAANGKTYSACSSATMPPEAAVGASFPPAEVAGFTGADGTGQVNFEVRSAVENESLGCSDTTPCSLVAIPIMGLSCDTDAPCRESGRLRAGSNNFAGEGVDAAVSPLYWWSASNWKNRIAVPLTFGLPPDACTVLDSRAPTAFYGSELMSQAALQWAPAYCLRQDRFKFQHNRLGDDPAFALLEKGGAPAAFVSGKRERSTKDPVGYAPTAITGFAVSYIIDEPDNAGERAELKLTPRLLAKLLTQSYTGSARGQGHPGMEANPQSLNVDPEFIALNPGLDTITRESAAAVLSLSESSDVIKTLTDYVVSDPEAKAFIAGTKDPWGMAVNPSYRKLKLPVSDFPLRDTYVPPSAQECYTLNPAPYFGQLAAPVSSLRKVAEAVLDAWPNTQTRCDRASTSDPYKVGRVDRQGVGTRFMLGIVSLGDAERFGLRTASLRSAGGAFVAPTEGTMAAAIKTAKPGKTGQPFDFTQKGIRATEGAYPGTMIVYTAARLTGMEKADATNVSSFIRIATTEGQVEGSGNGTLPAGYLPIVKTGVTAKLWASAQAVAKLVKAQKEPAAAPTKGAPKPATPAEAVPAAAAPAADAPADQAVAAAPATTTTDTIATAAQTSGQAQSLLPVLVALLLVAGLGGPGVRLAAEWRRRR